MNRKYKIAILTVVILVAASFFAYNYLHPKNDKITATGMIEITQANLTSKVSGYLVKCDFIEGNQVEANKIIAQIDKTDYQLKYMQAVQAYQSAIAKLDDLNSGSRQAELDAQYALMQSSKKAMDKAVLEYNRFEQLYKQGAISSQELDNYRLIMTNNTGLYSQAKAQYQLAVEGTRVDQIKAQKHLVEQLDYASKEAKANLEYTDLKAPLNGRILSKNYQQGEFILPGAPIATIGDLSDCWVKIYIPSTDLGRVKFAQKAIVKIDSYPNKTFEGHVKEIATQAEFTPRQTITKDERANLVFAVKIALDNKEEIFKPGMPAEVILQ